MSTQHKRPVASRAWRFFTQKRYSVSDVCIILLVTSQVTVWLR